VKNSTVASFGSGVGEAVALTPWNETSVLLKEDSVDKIIPNGPLVIDGEVVAFKTSKQLVYGGVAQEFVSGSKQILCYPECSLQYKRFSDAVRVYKPVQVYVFREEDFASRPNRGLVGFKDFTISADNDDTTDHTLCFSLKVVRNGFVVFNDKVDGTFTVRARIKASNYVVPVDWWDVSSSKKISDYYFEVSTYDCESKEKYNTFYLRGIY
jgi:hypothetical protein